MQILMGESLGPEATDATIDATVGRMIRMARRMFGNTQNSAQIIIKHNNNNTTISAMVRPRVVA